MNKKNIIILLAVHLVCQVLAAQISITETDESREDSSLFMYDNSGLKFKSNHVNLGFVYNGDTVIKNFECYNSKKTPVKLTFDKLPEHIQISEKSEIIPPHKSATFELKYFTTLIDDWDVVIDRIPVEINSDKKLQHPLTVTANIRENFSDLSEEERNSSPVASFKQSKFDFGETQQNKKVKHHFIMYNKGGRDLIIHKLKAACGCTIIQPKRKVIPPGGKTKITVIFNPKGYSDMVHKTITVITNDPKNYKQYLQIEGKVVTDR
jgi:hypothetical protein